LIHESKELAMNSSGQNSIAGNSGSSEFPASSSSEFEATLRLLASLPAPEGLEERVQVGLRAGLRAAPRRARILAWPTALRLDNTWIRSSLARSAAAAAIFAVVVGGGWGVYSRVQPVQPARAVTIPPHVSAQGGFSSAGAMRTPQTLNGPLVAAPAVTPPAAGAPPAVIPAVKPAVKPADKSASAKKTAAEPATPPATVQPAVIPAK
jgi:hypothetical protein